MASIIKKLQESANGHKTPPSPTPNSHGHKELTRDISALSVDKEVRKSGTPKAKVETKTKKVSEYCHAPVSMEREKGKPVEVPQPLGKKKYGLKDIVIDRTLGTGSFGRVHLMKLKENNQYCALKVLRKADVVKMRQLEHTINERAILSELNHPFLVGLVGTFQDAENVYFIMEYIQGGELFSYLRKYVVLSL
jgi:protein kinase A